MAAVSAPSTAPMAAAAPAADESAAAPAAMATPMAVPQSTPPPNGCALSFVQSNSSYSKFQQILNAAPYTSNFSSERSASPLFCAQLRLLCAQLPVFSLQDHVPAVATYRVLTSSGLLLTFAAAIAAAYCVVMCWKSSCWRTSCCNSALSGRSQISAACITEASGDIYKNQEGDPLPCSP